jgi:hypothetical protein
MESDALLLKVERILLGLEDEERNAGRDLQGLIAPGRIKRLPEDEE